MVDKQLTLVAEKVQAAMDVQGLSIRDVAEKAGSTYEHVRNIVRGNVVPSKHYLRTLVDVLSLDLKEMEKLATADRIRTKYGKIPLELAGKNPELEPIERAWSHLSDQHKQDLVAMAQTFSKRDKAETRN